VVLATARPRVDDWPGDVAALADALAIGRFAVAGHSSGGPYAVGCAALLPERVTALLAMAADSSRARASTCRSPTLSRWRAQAERPSCQRAPHTAASIPGAQFRALPGHGHLTILSELPVLASELIASD